LLLSPVIGAILLVLSIVSSATHNRYFGSWLLGEEVVLQKQKGRLLVFQDGQPLWSVPLTNIESGFYNGVDRVVFETAFRHDLHVGCSEKQAEGLMRLAGVGVDDRALRIPLASFAMSYAPGRVFGCISLLALVPLGVVWAIGLVVLLALWLFEGSTPHWQNLLLMSSALFGSVFGLWLLWRRREVVIGTDGVRIIGAIMRRFIPYQDIARVVTVGERVDLHTRSGRRHVMVVRYRTPLSSQTSRGPDGHWGKYALRYRLKRAVARHYLKDAGIVLEQLTRRNRTMDVWEEDLRRMAASAGGYRDAAVVRESLVSVAEDVTALPENRVGAVFALSTIDEQTIEYAETIVATCADPKLATAVEQAARGELDGEAIAAAMKSYHRADGLRIRWSNP